MKRNCILECKFQREEQLAIRTMSKLAGTLSSMWFCRKLIEAHRL